MRQTCQGAACSVSDDSSEGVTREQYTQTPAQCTAQALADFGDSPAARRRGQESRKRWRESVKAIVPRAHVVHTRPSTPDDHRPRDVERQASYAPDEWRPQYPARRSLSDRAPFAAQLAGWDPDRVADAEYPWSVP